MALILNADAMLPSDGDWRGWQEDQIQDIESREARFFDYTGVLATLTKWLAYDSAKQKIIVNTRLVNLGKPPILTQNQKNAALINILDYEANPITQAEMESVVNWFGERKRWLR